MLGKTALGFCQFPPAKVYLLAWSGPAAVETCQVVPLAIPVAESGVPIVGKVLASAGGAKSALAIEARRVFSTRNRLCRAISEAAMPRAMISSAILLAHPIADHSRAERDIEIERGTDSGFFPDWLAAVSAEHAPCLPGGGQRQFCGAAIG